jgi:hypothetical protein
MHEYEHEGAGWRLLQTVGLDGLIAPSILAVVHRLGWRLIPGAPASCRGIVCESEGCVRFDDRAPRQLALENIAHEVGHGAIRMWSGAGRHDEADADAVADALQMPGPGMRRLARRVGWDAVQWQLAYSDVAPSRIFRRAARVLEGVVVLRQGARREVHRADAVDRVDALRDLGDVERELYDAVRRSGAAQAHRSGVAAWPFVDPGARAGVAIVGPLSAWCPASP